MKVNPREKKFLLAAVAAIVVYVLIQFVIAPTSSAPVDTGIDQLALAQRTLRREKELVSADRLPAQVAALGARVGQEQKRLLAGSDANRAGAQLQTWLAQRAAQQQLEVVRTDFLPTSPVARNYVRVPVRIEMHGRITQIIAFLTSVTQGDPMASIDDAQFSTYDTAKQKQLLCVVVISGLMLKPASGGN